MRWRHAEGVCRFVSGACTASPTFCFLRDEPTRAHGLPERAPRGGSAPWPGLGRIPVMHRPTLPPRSQLCPPTPPRADADRARCVGPGGPERAADVTRAQHTVSGVCRGSAPSPQRLELTGTAFSLPWALMTLSMSGPSGNKAEGAVLPGSHGLVVSWTLGTNDCRSPGTRGPIACALRRAE